MQLACSQPRAILGPSGDQSEDHVGGSCAPLGYSVIRCALSVTMRHMHTSASLLMMEPMRVSFPAATSFFMICMSRATCIRLEQLTRECGGVQLAEGQHLPSLSARRCDASR